MCVWLSQSESADEETLLEREERELARWRALRQSAAAAATTVASTMAAAR